MACWLAERRIARAPGAPMGTQALTGQGPVRDGRPRLPRAIERRARLVGLRLSYRARRTFSRGRPVGPQGREGQAGRGLSVSARVEQVRASARRAIITCSAALGHFSKELDRAMFLNCGLDPDSGVRGY